MSAQTIASGNHRDSLTENCVMELVALEYLRGQGIVSTQDLLRLKTDTPGCTAPWITHAAQAVNDRLGDEERQRLGLLIPRLLHDARMPADVEKTKRVAVRLSCWAARSVLHLVPVENLEVATRAIVTAEAWLSGDATEQECGRAAAAAYVSAAAAYTASAACASPADPTAPYVYYASYATASAAVDRPIEMDLVLWLDELLDAHVKALASEGLLGMDDAFEEWTIPEQVGGS